VCNTRTVGEAHLPATLSHSILLEPVLRGQNSGINMSDHERSRSQSLKFASTESLLHCVNGSHAF
jgi:hypothetical protein